MEINYTEIFKHALTIFGLGGITLFIVTKLIERFIIEPVAEFRDTIKEITFSLVYYANIYSNAPSDTLPKELLNEASRSIRTLSAKLYASIDHINCYSVFSFFKVLPKYKDSRDAARNLMNLSNAVYSKHFGDATSVADTVKKLLHIPIKD